MDEGRRYKGRRGQARATDPERWKIQKGCADEAMKRNLLVVLPTGSGKTLIAIKVIELTLELEPARRIIFMAPNNHLVEQQCRAIEDPPPWTLVPHLATMDECEEPHRTIGVCESRQPGVDLGDQRTDFAHVFKSCQVVACTPAKLMHALMCGRVSMDEIALLIFDEAHHYVGSEPYAVLMQYFYRPLPVERRPRVLALTASPVERPSTEEDQQTEGARRALAKIEAELDAEAWTAPLGAPRTPCPGTPRSPRHCLAFPAPPGMPGNPLAPSGTPPLPF